MGTPQAGSMGFNPRLPLPGGDAFPWRTPGPACLVSIHASRCREAMLQPFDAINANLLFQSTPPVAGRRCRIALGQHQGDVPVSIHASRCREAMPVIVPRTTSLPAFQSTPPVAGRRCILFLLVVLRC